ncbi:hypothetical protein [Olsenella sp. Marseille-P4559]|uniref:hypothetical protein n=1 Tax=Olsenella sp. Marseille-P4559 TaxID=2364795 RepID=UPI001031E678|nr:hypothetical protein [Olsenella sp. Marseille-P4559]
MADIFLSVFSIVMTAIVGVLSATIRAQREKARAFDDRYKSEHDLLLKGMQVLMRAELFKLHQEYVQSGKPVPLDIKEQANSVHEVYARLGGNGVGTHLWKELINAHASTEREYDHD